MLRFCVSYVCVCPVLRCLRLWCLVLRASCVCVFLSLSCVCVLPAVFAFVLCACVFFLWVCVFACCACHVLCLSCCVLCLCLCACMLVLCLRAGFVLCALYVSAFSPLRGVLRRGPWCVVLWCGLWCVVRRVVCCLAGLWVAFLPARACVVLRPGLCSVCRWRWQVGNLSGRIHSCIRGGLAAGRSRIFSYRITDRSLPLAVQ